MIQHDKEMARHDTIRYNDARSPMRNADENEQGMLCSSASLPFSPGARVPSLSPPPFGSQGPRPSESFLALRSEARQGKDVI